MNFKNVNFLLEFEAKPYNLTSWMLKDVRNNVYEILGFFVCFLIKITNMYIVNVSKFTLIEIMIWSIDFITYLCVFV